jgi:hypothetical protein
MQPSVRDDAYRMLAASPCLESGYVQVPRTRLYLDVEEHVFGEG